MPVKAVGNEFLVNTTRTGNQTSPSLAMLDGGGCVAVWIDESQSGGNTGGSSIRGQIYDAGGAKRGGEFLVNTVTSGDLFRPAVSRTATGGFIAVWMNPASLRAQIFDASGSKIGNEFVAATMEQTTLPVAGAVYYRSTPDVAALANGGFAITWTELGVAIRGTRVQLLDAAGNPVGGTTNLPAASASSSKVAALSGGGFVVAFEVPVAGGGSSITDVHAQIFGSNGVKAGSEFVVNTTGTKLASQSSPDVAALAGGGFVVTWTDASKSGGDGSDTEVRGRLFDASGQSVGSEFLVNTNTVGMQANASVVGLPAGGFVAAWNDYSAGGDGSKSSVHAQAFSASGAKVGYELLVNTTTAEDQVGPTMATLSNGQVAVAWTDNSALIGTPYGTDVRGQVLSVESIDTSRRLLVHDGAQGRELQMDAYVGPVSWLKNQYIGLSTGEAAIGSTDADFMSLQGGDDAAEGREGDDVLDGGTGSNFLTGGSGTDTFFVDGRNSGTTWSTVTDFEAGEWATAWGWRQGTSTLTWADMQGADGYKGATAHIDIDGNGTIDTSMTFTGKAVGAVITMPGQVGSDAYLAFRLS